MPKNVVRCHQETSTLFVLPNVIRKSYNVRESRMEGMFLGGIRQVLLEEKKQKGTININQKQLL